MLELTTVATLNYRTVVAQDFERMWARHSLIWSFVSIIRSALTSDLEP